MSVIQRDIVLSIKPQYCDKILDGEKIVELRRRFPISGITGIVAHIYATSPVKSIVGSVKIVDVNKMSITDIWMEYSSSAIISKEDFEIYFEGVDQGFALALESAQRFTRCFCLDELRQNYNFHPPQSYAYIKPSLQKVLSDA